jgi:hypothetical protein
VNSSTGALTIVSSGPCEIQASETGQASGYAVASAVDQTFSVAPKTKGTTSLSLSPSSQIAAGTSVTYSASVSETSGSGSLTGTVSFSENNVAISSCQNESLVAGKATCTVNFPSSGSVTISATYANDPNFAGSTASVTQVVKGAKPVFSSANSDSVVEGHYFSFQVSASGSPTYSLSGSLPHGVTFNSATGVLSGTPTGCSGNYVVTISATNASGTTTQTFYLSVSAR